MIENVFNVAYKNKIQLKIRATAQQSWTFFSSTILRNKLSLWEFIRSKMIYKYITLKESNYLTSKFRDKSIKIRLFTYSALTTTVNH